MGFDLLLQSDAENSGFCDVELAARLLPALGLRAVSSVHWVFESPSEWMELYLGQVEVGPGIGGDARPITDGRFNQASCHPKPVSPRTLALVHSFAQSLGWSIFDGQNNLFWRDALPAPMAVSPIDVKRAEDPTTIAKDDWTGWGAALREATGGAWWVGHQTDSGIGNFIERRSGSALTLEERREGASASLALSADQTRVLTGASENEQWLALRTLGTETRPGIRYPLRPSAAWLPDWPQAFVALTRSRRYLGAPLAGSDHAVAQALIHLEKEQARLVIVDPEADQVYPLRPDELLHDGSYGISKLIVSGDGESAVVLMAEALHVFSLSTGELRWRIQSIHEHSQFRAVATSACGRWLAVGGLAPPRNPECLRVFECHSGKLVLALSREALGHPASSVSALAFHASGWLAVGIGDGAVLLVYPDGRTREAAVLRGEVKCFAFSRDGKALLAAGTHPGVLQIPIPQEEQLAALPTLATKTTAQRQACVRSWQFADMEPVWSTRLEEILHHSSLSPSQKAERLAQLENIDAILSRLAEARPKDEFETWTVLHTLALRAKARNIFLEPNYYPLVESKLNEVSEGYRLDTMSLVIDVVAPERRDALVLANLEPPAWARFGLASPDAAARVLVETIAAWPRGIYSDLKKRFHPLEYAFGYDAKQFWQRANDALIRLGAAALPHLDGALASPCQNRKCFRQRVIALRSRGVLNPRPALGHRGRKARRKEVAFKAPSLSFLAILVSRIQSLAHLLGQVPDSEGLLDEVGALHQQAPLGDDFPGVAGHEDCFEVGARAQELGLEFLAVHPGHDHIRQQQVNGARVLLGNPADLQGILRR